MRWSADDGTLRSMQTDLPIRTIQAELLRAIPPGCRTIVRAPTGSGKSTQIPQMLLEGGGAGPGQIVVLQPRRIAARLLAARVAQERGTPLGGEIGYQVRFERVSGPQTRVRFVTEGLLLRQLMAEPECPDIGTLIFDEFHERHLYTDLTLAQALRLQSGPRPDLRILVMSATLAIEPLRAFLGKGETLVSEGRTFPVDIEYLPHPPPAREPVWETAAEEAARLVEEGLDGDVLIFMPGGYEIARTVQSLRTRSSLRGIAILPLHGEMSLASQQSALAPSVNRKIVVATNVAETSLTIEGVCAVIDSGLARMSRYDPRRGINALTVERISRASAEQRAGRAGRLAPGRCVRLWTERDHTTRPTAEVPEIRRVELSEAVLMLKACGVEDVAGLRWLDPPEPASLDRALELLADLGALDSGGSLTPMGRRMAAFPTHPRLARMLITAAESGCVHQAALIAAIMQGRSLLVRRADGETRDLRDDVLGEKPSSDLFRLMRAWSAARDCGFDVERCSRLGIHAQTARQIRPALAHFLRIARSMHLPISETAPGDEALQKGLLAAFPDHLARRLDGGTLRCNLVHGRRGVLDRESAVQHAPLFVAAEMAEIEGRDLQIVLSLATEVQEAWLDELFPGEVQDSIRVEWDRTARRAVARRERIFRGLILASQAHEPPPAEEAARVLAEAIASGEVTLPGWDDRVNQWIERLHFLARTCPDLGLPDFDEEARRRAIRMLCEGASSYRDVKDGDVWTAVRATVPPAQQRLVERHAPDRIDLPKGARGRMVYPMDGPPRLTARIQDLYGLTETPRIAMGRVPVTVDILGPNFRSVQITSDLTRFWKETYPGIRKSLQRKYPKHEWR